MLENDIELEDPWGGIGVVGNDSSAFSGTFDGRGHKISNVVFSNLSSNKYRGFFGLVTDGVIKNLTISGSGFGDTAPSGEYGCAMFVGRMQTAVATDGNGASESAPVSRIENCVAEGAITANHNAAGFVVQLCAGTIKDCTNRVSLTGLLNAGDGCSKKTGGFVGQGQGQGGKSIQVNFLNCVNEGEVTAEGAASEGVGGIVGQVNLLTLTIKDCVNKAAVTNPSTDTSKVGQIVGKANNSATVSGTNRVRPDGLAVGSYTATSFYMDGTSYATLPADDDGLVTLVHDADVVSGGTYEVMAQGRTYTLGNEGDSVTFDESLATPTVALASALSDDHVVQKTSDGNLVTYVVAAA